MALVPERLRNSVALLYAGDSRCSTLLRPAATAVIVGKLIGSGDRLRTYVVTAGHVISGLRSTGAGGIRFNLSVQRSPVFPLEFDRWTFSTTTDLAISEVSAGALQSQGFQFSWVPSEQFVTDSMIVDWRIGPGDDVFMVGMLHNHLGEQRNEPIVRRGAIALLPRDLIRVEAAPYTFKNIYGYLVELWSIGGHSGSPTFIYHPTARIPGMHEGGGSDPALLGIVQGHFLAEDSSGEHTGIAVVVPANEIASLLGYPELEEEHLRRVAETSR